MLRVLKFVYISSADLVYWEQENEIIQILSKKNRRYFDVRW